MYKWLLIGLLCPFTLAAQDLPAIESKTKGLQRQQGFIPYYWESAGGKLWIELPAEGLECLLVQSLAAGLGLNETGLDRGMLGPTKLVRFVRVGNKLLLEQPNLRYRADDGITGERMAVEQSFPSSTLWDFEITAQTGDRVLIDATEFFLSDRMNLAVQLRDQGEPAFSVDRNRSVIYLPRTKAFPRNTEVEASITYQRPPGAGGRLQAVAPDPDAITLRLHYSFVQLPDNNYRPRVYDPRSGFGALSYTDFSTPVGTPLEKRFIRRHRLQKKNPDAAKSEAVEPIVYYLDHGTPEPIRSALLEGARWWNEAFEAAGFINAFQVKMLPEDADPMDVRYNVINWVHRSTRGWSYGASVTDPRTGEIIKGHVTLGSQRVRQDYLIAAGLLAPYLEGKPMPEKDDPMLQMALARLRQLSAHEVGHTLGISHNFAASASGRASVMDYPHPLVQLDAEGKPDLSRAYDTGVGEWDKMVIRYGYTEFVPGTDEAQALNRILQEGLGKGLRFITDRDARDPGGMHPQAHLWDNGTDAAEVLKEVLRVRIAALRRFGVHQIPAGAPMSTLEEALVPIYFYHRYQAEAVAKLVGGMQYSYALRGDGQTVTAAVSAEAQRKALDALLACLDPELLEIPDTIAALIPPRPPGYGYTPELFPRRTGLSFDRLAAAEAAVDLVLSLLFHPARLNRLAVQEGFDAASLMKQLVASTWQQPRAVGFRGQIQLQTEQLLLSYLAGAVRNKENNFVVRAAAEQQIQELKSYMQGRLKSASGAYRGHLSLALKRIEDPDDFAAPKPVALPPGAPIGCESE